MSKFGKLSLTQKGINALIKAQAGETLVFSKIKMGDASNVQEDYSSLNDLVSPKLSANIINGTATGNTYTVEAQFSNQGLTEGFYWREIGLYIKDNQSGNDVLFGYANSGAYADFIPATMSEIYTKNVRIAVSVDDAKEVTINASPEDYVTVGMFNEHLNNKVDKVHGMGLSHNDYSDAEKEKLDKVVNDLSNAVTNINKSIEEVEKQFDSYTTKQELQNVIQTLFNGISKDITPLLEDMERLENSIKNINNIAGTNNISSIGDGTVTGAILKLYEMIQSLPAITSGTALPSGGKDGDLYIMHE